MVGLLTLAQTAPSPTVGLLTLAATDADGRCPC